MLAAAAYDFLFLKEMPTCLRKDRRVSLGSSRDLQVTASIGKISLENNRDERARRNVTITQNFIVTLALVIMSCMQ